MLQERTGEYRVWVSLFLLVSRMNQLIEVSVPGLCWKLSSPVFCEVLAADGLADFVQRMLAAVSPATGMTSSALESASVSSPASVLMLDV